MNKIPLLECCDLSEDGEADTSVNPLEVMKKKRKGLAANPQQQLMMPRLLVELSGAYRTRESEQFQRVTHKHTHTFINSAFK